MLLNLILIWQESYLSKDWKLTMLYSPAVTVVGERNKAFFPDCTLLSSVNWIHGSHTHSVMAVLMLMVFKYLAMPAEEFSPSKPSATTTLTEQFPWQSPYVKANPLMTFCMKHWNKNHPIFLNKKVRDPKVFYKINED